MIENLVHSPMFVNFRTEQLNYHAKRLRDMLGPLLNDDCARAEAGKEIGNIAAASWDLAVKMATSHLTFQIYFPDTNTKFSSATMIAKDNNTEPARLQTSQTRLKLVVTPVITLRDDRGTTIIARSLHPSCVLTMP